MARDKIGARKPAAINSDIENRLNGGDEHSLVGVLTSEPGPEPVDVGAITAAAFAAGNLVVYRVGDGTAAVNANATAVFLDEYTPAGVLVRSIALPTADAGAQQILTASGTANSEGYLTLSTDGHFLIMTGYDAAVGTTGITTSASASINRVVGRVLADGTIDTSTALSDFSTGSNPRGVVSTNGTSLWVDGGAGGIRSTTLGSTTSLQLSTTVTNLRVAQIFDGQLYVSSGSGAFRIAAVGTGLPTTSGQTITNLTFSGGNAHPLGSPYGFFFADLTAGVSGVDTLYVCDDGIGLLKFSLVAGSWVENGLVGVNADDYRGLTGSVSGTTVTLYAVRDNGSSADTIVSLIDTGGYNAAFSTTTPTLVATGNANSAFRGIAFAPTSAGDLSINDVSAAEGNLGTTNVTFTVTRAGSSVGAIGATWTLTLSGTANAADFTTTPQTGTVSFANGETSKTITITVQGDLVYENNETFTVVLTNATGGATITDAIGDGTITNDDAPVAPAVDLNGGDPGIDFSGGYFEQGSGALIGSAITVTAGSLPITSATIAITDALAGDLLSVSGTLPATIIVSLSSTATNLILTGTGSDADWAAALALVVYTSSSDNPDAYGTDTARTISVTVTDGVAPGTAAIATIAISADNDAPVLGGLDGDSVTFTEGDSYVVLDNNAPIASVTDPDNENFDHGFVEVGIMSGGTADDEFFVIDFFPGVGRSGNDIYVNSILIGAVTNEGPGAILRIDLNANATADLVATLLDYIGFRNASEDPLAGDRQVTWLLNDGQGGADVALSTVTVVPVDDIPTVEVPATTVTYTEQLGQATLDSMLNLTDPDGPTTLSGATVSIITGLVASDDLLTFDNGLASSYGIAGSYDQNTGVLTFTGDATTAQYQEVLRTVAYDNAGGDVPVAGDRVIQFAISAAPGTTAAGPGGHTDVANDDLVTVSVVAVNDAPMPGLPASYDATEQVALDLKDSITISDADAGGGTLTVTLSVGYGVINADAGSTGVMITGSGTNMVTVTGTLTQINDFTYSGSDSLLTYLADGDNPPASTMLNLSVNDNGNSGGPAETGTTMATINIAGVNDAPAVQNLSGDFATFSIGDAYAYFDVGQNALLLDPDSDFAGGAILIDLNAGENGGEDVFFIVENAHVTLGAVQMDGGQDVLVDGIVVGYYSGQGAGGQVSVVNFNMLANADAVEQVLRAYAYSNTAGSALHPGLRIVDINIYDGDGEVAVVHSSVSVSATPPSVEPTYINLSDDDITYTENDPDLVLDGALTVTDADSSSIASAVVAITNGYVMGEDGLTFDGGLASSYGISGSFNAATGQLELSGAATLAQYQEVLRTVAYVNNGGDNPTAGDRTIEFSVLSGDTLYFSGNGHFYQFISSAGINWAQANAAAQAMSLFGLQGYLATVTSAAENAFIQSRLGGTGWIGASDSGVERQWYWVTGPEAGTFFFQQDEFNSGGTPIGGAYANWAGGEPNQSGDEDYAHFYGDGSWNDLPGDAGVDGFVVEYGGYAGPAPANPISTLTIHVMAVNDPADIFGIDFGDVSEDGFLNANGFLVAIDPDGSSDFQPEMLTGTYGALTIDDNGNWEYTLANGQANVQALKSSSNPTDVFTVHSADGTEHDITITVHGADDAAMITGTDTGSVTEDGMLTTGGTLVADDPDDGDTGFQAADQLSGFGAFALQSNGDWTYTLDNAAAQGLGVGEQATDTFTIHSADGTSHDVVITINGTNDRAQGTSNTITVDEDGSYVFVYADFGYSDVDGDDMAGVYIHAASLTGGTLYDDGVAITSNSYFLSTADLNAGHLTYQPAPDANGAALSSFGFQVVDTNGNATGLDATTRTMTIDVNSVNDAPDATPVGFTLAPGAYRSFNSMSFGFSDVDGDNITGITITGALQGTRVIYDPDGIGFGVAGITASGFFSLSSFGDLYVTLAPDYSAYGPTYGFGFTVSDDGGTANGGVDTSGLRIMGFGVASPPVVSTPIPDQVRNEDNLFVYQVPAGTFTDPDSTLTYSASLAGGMPLPSWLSFDPGTQLFSGQLPQDFSGTISLRVTASDGETDVFDEFDLNVMGIADGANIRLSEGGPYRTIGTFNMFGGIDDPRVDLVEQDETYPRTAATDDGGWVMVWTQTGGNPNILAQRFDPNGDRNESVIFITGGGGPTEGQPDVTSLAGGGFAVAFVSNGGGEISVQIYGPTGINPTATVILPDTGAEQTPTITRLSDGSLLVTWEVPGASTTISGIRLDASGALIDATPQTIRAGADNFEANDNPTPHAVTALAGGRFAATWVEGGDVRVAVYTPGASWTMSALVTLDEGALNDRSPTVTTLSDGRFLVVWEASDGGPSDLYGQFFTAAGALDGGPVLLTGSIPSSEFEPNVSALEGGGFALTWLGNDGLNSTLDVRLQTFDADGNPVGATTSVTNTGFTPNPGAGAINEGDATLTTLSDGRIVLSWVDPDPDTVDPRATGDDLRYQIFDPGGAPTLIEPIGASSFELPMDISLFDTSETLDVVIIQGVNDYGWQLAVGHYDEFFEYDPGNFLDAAWVIVRGYSAAEDAFLDALLAGTAEIEILTGGFAPAAQFFLGITAITSDGGSQRQAITRDLVVEFANTPPTAVDDVLAATEDTPVTYAAADLVGNDDDGGDGGPLVITAVSNFTGGVAVLNGDGTVTFTPTLNFNGVAGFDYVVSDGTDTDTGHATVNVAAVNDAVTGSAPTSLSLNEDAVNVAVTGLSISDVDAALAPAGVYEVMLSATHGPLTLATLTGLTFTNGDGTADATMTFHGTLADINAALATASYTPDADYYGTDAAGIVLQVTDTFGGIVATGTGSATSDSDSISVTVNAVNDAPAGTNGSATFNEDTSYTFSAADFGFTDPVEGDAFLSVFITTLPANGSLTLSGNPVMAGQEIPVGQIGNLVFTPAVNGNGMGYASFTFQVRDNGGILNGGIDTDQSANTFTLNVTPVNDAPAIDLNGAAGGTGSIASYTENAAATQLAPNGTVVDVDMLDFDTGVLTVTISAGGSASDILSVINVGNGAGQIGVSGATVSYGGTAIGTIAGGSGGTPLTVTFNASSSQAAVQALVRQIGFAVNSENPSTALRTIQFSLTDGDGGTSNTASANTTVIAVNDAPAGTDGSATINEDGSYTFARADFGFSDPAEGHAFIAVIVTTLPANGTLYRDNDGPGGAAPVAVMAGDFILTSLIDAGGLTFVPAANANGAPYTSFTFQVVDGGGTTNGGQDTDQSPNSFTINVTAVNDAPVNNVPGATQNVNEDGGLTFSSGNGNLITVSDLDAGAEDVTVTLTVLHGTLAVGGNAGLTFLTGDGTATVSFAGTVAEVNNALNGLIYTPAANYNGPDTLQIQTSDNGNSGTGGTLTDTDMVAINVVSINDAPAGTDKAVTINEDATYVFATADFGFTDPNDSPANSLLAVTFTTLPTNGTLFYDADGAGGNAPAAVTAGQSILASEIALGKVTFVPALNGNGSPLSSFTFQVQDDGGTGSGGVDLDPSANSFTINVSAVNDAPVNNVPGGQSVNEDASLVLSTANSNAIQVSDVDAGSGSVSVTLSVAHGTLTLASTTGLSFSGGSNGTAGFTITGTLTDLNAALGSGLTYAPTGDYNGPDAIAVQTTDNGNTGSGGAGTDSDSISITVNSVNDAPQGTDNSVTGSEDDPLVFTAANFGFSDPVEGNAFLAVKITTLPAAGTLFLDSDGIGVGAAPVAVSAGQFISIADINAGHLYFQPVMDAFGNNYASFTFQVQDDGGTMNGGVDLDQSANTMTINITPDNLPPVVDLNGAGAGINYTTAFTEDGAAVAIGAGILVSDPDSGLGDMIESATITLTDAIAGDTLTIVGALPPGISAATTTPAGQIVITLTGTASQADYQTALGQIRYATTSQNPDVFGTDTSRTITVVVNDGLVDSATATATINIVAIDDAPVAQPDAFTITESQTIVSGNLFADNGSGADDDPDGPPLAISAVNGSGANVNNQITLGSGALLTVHSDGTFDYDPNGAFLPTPTPGSGASNTPAHDSFSYTLSGGNTVTVSITLTGLDTDDFLLGTAGTDILMGGNGNDTYVVGNASDQVIEGAGAGSDTVYALVSYQLTAGQEIERLSAVDWSQTTPLNLTGNGIANLIEGNAGANILNGAGGADVMIGFGGDDIYVVDNAGDQALEVAGQGSDVVYALTDYALTPDSDLERLSSIDWTQTSALNLTGNSLANLIEGNAGVNLLNGAAGADTLVGFGGDDVYIVENFGDQVIESAGQGNDLVYALADYVLNAGASVEHLSAIEWAQTGALNITGNEIANLIEGNFGTNILDGGGGADTLVGFGGNDTYYVDQAGDIVYEAAGQGNDAVYASASYTLTAGQEIELLAASNFSSTMALNLTGNELANTIYGNAGSNVLDGKGGSDILVGLAGADTFAFTTALGAGNVDVVSDFTAGIDKVALDDAVFTAIGPLGALNANAFHTGSAAHDADDRIIYNSATGQLFYDADGDGAGAAVQFATLSAGLTLTATDFTVI